jgi:hypothetical protein
MARGAVLALLAAGIAAAQETPSRPGDVVAAERVEVLTLDVLAVDKKDRPVFGLVAADFEVRVAGKLQTLEFFEAPVPGGARSSREGRADSEERIAGTTTPFTPGGATVRHVLFYIDLEQLPKRSIFDAAAALHKALEHPAAGRYGLATHFGGVSARVWDTATSDAVEKEADAMAADATARTSEMTASGRGPGAPPPQEGSPPDYEERQFAERALIDDYVNAACAGLDTRNETQAISRYLSSEYRRVREGVRQLRETCERFAALEGPRHLIVVSEGYERVPGFNFLARLQTQQRDTCSAGSASSAQAASRPGCRGRIAPSGRDASAPPWLRSSTPTSSRAGSARPASPSTSSIPARRDGICRRPRTASLPRAPFGTTRTAISRTDRFASSTRPAACRAFRFRTSRPPSRRFSTPLPRPTGSACASRASI